MPRLSYFTHPYVLGSVTALSTVLMMGLPGLALQYNPPNRGAPSNTWNAGSRTGPCGDLTAVQPTATNWGETLRSHPTFGIYVAEPATNLTFELRDEQTQEIIHRVTFEQVQGPGISLYTLPDTAPALGIDQYYRWQVSLECEQFNTANIQYTGDKQSGGMVVRRAASDELKTRVDTATEEELPDLLAANGLWYDAVHALLMQQQAGDPEQWTDTWQTLLTHPMVQLDNLLEATLVNCCLAVDCPATAPLETNADDTAPSA